MEDTLTFYGGEVKALGNGKVGGYAILFSTPKEPDLCGDFFTKDTDFFVENEGTAIMLYDHGLDGTLKRRKLGRGTLRMLDAGLWYEAQLEMRDEYDKAIYGLVEKKKLGWSTGSASHLVERERVGKAWYIKSWPIIEVSLTPVPCEPRTEAVPLKSLALEHIEIEQMVKSCAEFDIDGIPAIKQFCEDVSPSSLKHAAQRSESAVAAVEEFVTIGTVLGEAFHSYKSRLVRHTENRFVKDGRPISPMDAKQVEDALAQLVKVEDLFASVKSDLDSIRKLSRMAQDHREGLDQAARLELWNFQRISGIKPEGVNLND